MCAPCLARQHHAKEHFGGHRFENGLLRRRAVIPFPFKPFYLRLRTEVFGAPPGFLAPATRGNSSLGEELRSLPLRTQGHRTALSAATQERPGAHSGHCTEREGGTGLSPGPRRSAGLLGAGCRGQRCQLPFSLPDPNPRRAAVCVNLSRWTTSRPHSTRPRATSPFNLASLPSSLLRWSSSPALFWHLRRSSTTRSSSPRSRTATCPTWPRPTTARRNAQTFKGCLGNWKRCSQNPAKRLVEPSAWATLPVDRRALRRGASCEDFWRFLSVSPRCFPFPDPVTNRMPLLAPSLPLCYFHQNLSC